MTDVNFDKIQVIFIDWYLTLTSVTFLNKLKIENHAVFKKFIEIIFEQNPSGWQYDWARGKLAKEDVAQKISQAGIMPYDNVLKTFADCCAHQTVDFPEVFKTINTIREKGKKVVLATDNWDVFCDYTIPNLGLDKYFDDIISSNQVGFLKRDEQPKSLPFFDNYLKNNHIAYQNSLLIDDNALNIDICQKHQMAGIMVKDSRDTVNILQQMAQK